MRMGRGEGEGVKVASQIPDLAACFLYYDTDDPEERQV